MNTMISDQLSQTLSQCDKTWYYIYEQEGTSASDLKSMLKLQERMRGADKRKVVEVPDSVAIVGSGWSHWVVEELEKACAAKGKRRNEGRKCNVHCVNMDLWVLMRRSLQCGLRKRTMSMKSLP